MDKARFGEIVVGQTTKLVGSLEKLIVLRSVYFDVGFNAGGANEILDTDVEAYGTTAAAIGSIMTAIDHIGHLCQMLDEGTTPMVADYSASFNRVRRE